MGVQVCRLPALKPLKRSKPSKPLKPSKPSKASKRLAVCQPSCSQQASQGHTSMASYGRPSLPFARPKTLKTLQTLPQGHTSMASYGHPSLPFASPLAANRHPRATHQWLLMGVQVCRLPALKPLKPSKPSKPLKPSKLSKASKRLAVCQPSCSQQASHGHTSMASYGRPSLPFARPKTLKTLQTLQTLKTLQSLQTLSRLLALLQPTGIPGPHINGFLWASKSAVCQPSCSQQAPQGHTSMASYGRPNLPFARPKTLKTLQTLQTLKTLQTLQSLQTLSRLPALLQPTGTPGPHINGFLWASKSAVCPP